MPRPNLVTPQPGVVVADLFTPKSLEELTARLRAGGGRDPVPPVDLRYLNRVVAYVPEDMTVTVETGLTLEALQTAVRPGGQWLPLDPPQSDVLSLRTLIEENRSGPRRWGCGTVREHLLGLQAVLADGTLIRSGGRVVKNVAGFDVAKLFVGSRGALGMVVEATFKLQPRPCQEQVLAKTFRDWTEVEATLQHIAASALDPVVLDLYRLGREDAAAGSVAGVRMILGLAGMAEDVAAQSEQAHGLGFTEPANLDYEARFWAEGGEPPVRGSVLPSRLTQCLEALGPHPFVARAGNGVIFTRAALPAWAQREPAPGVVRLSERLRLAFDAGGIWRKKNL